MLGARVPVLGVSAVRTGCGKSQVARHVAQLCAAHARRVAVVRHPMPYGELAAARIQRFARRADLDAAQVTIEEREEFEPHLAAGQVVYAGVDYQAVTCAAESEADVIVWDGGNNDFPFLRPDLHIVVVDALRPEQLASHHPGEAVVRMADVCVINKVDSARPDAVATLRERLAELAPRATIVLAASPVTLDDALAIKDRRVVVVEDGPTSTHGGMAYGAGTLAARAAGAREIVDPRPYAVGTLRHAYRDYPHLGAIVPALGYDRAAVSDLAATLARVPAEVVVVGTPIDLAALVGGNKPCVRARYGYADAGTPTLAAILERRFFARAAG